MIAKIFAAVLVVAAIMFVIIGVTSIIAICDDKFVYENIIESERKRDDIPR